MSFDVPDVPASTGRQGAIPLPPARLLLTPHSKSSLNLSWDHSPSHTRAQPCTYIVEIRDPRTYSWSTYITALPGLLFTCSFDGILIDCSRLDTSVQLRGLNLNHIYSIRVRAENTFGVSDPSQPVTSRLLTRGMLSKPMIDSYSLSRIIHSDDRRDGDDQEPISKTRRPPTSTYDEYGNHRVVLRQISQHCCSFFRYSTIITSGWS